MKAVNSDLNNLVDSLKEDLVSLSDRLTAEESPETVNTTPDIAPTDSDEKHDTVDTIALPSKSITRAEAAKQIRTLLTKYCDATSESSLYSHSIRIHPHNNAIIANQSMPTHTDAIADMDINEGQLPLQPIVSNIESRPSSIEDYQEHKQEHIDLAVSAAIVTPAAAPVTAAPVSAAAAAAAHVCGDGKQCQSHVSDRFGDVNPPLFSANSQRLQRPQLHSQQLPFNNGQSMDRHYYASYVGGCIGDCFSAVVRHSCGPIQCCMLFQILLLTLLVLVFYNMHEVRLTFSTLTQWKELHVEQIRLETKQSIEQQQLQYNLNVDVDKLKAEHEHQERMAMITMADNSMKRFIEANTDTTEFWSLNPMRLGTEAQVTSRTHFSEADVGQFRSEIMGFVRKEIEYTSADDYIKEQLEKSKRMDEIGDGECSTDHDKSDNIGNVMKGHDSFDDL